MQLQPGDILLHNPFATLLWCIEHGTMPSFVSVLHAVLAAVYFVVTWSPYSHVIQYVGGGVFVHTRYGKVRGDKVPDFPPGYLETSRIVRLHSDRLQKDIDVNDLHAVFTESIGVYNPDYTTIFLTPFFRLAYYLGLIPKDYRKDYEYFNCATFLIRKWKELGVDLFPDKCDVGVYPSDFLALERVK